MAKVVKFFTKEIASLNLECTPANKYKCQLISRITRAVNFCTSYKMNHADLGPFKTFPYLFQEGQKESWNSNCLTSIGRKKEIYVSNVLVVHYLELE